MNDFLQYLKFSFLFKIQFHSLKGSLKNFSKKHPKRILVIGTFVRFDKGTCAYVNNLRKHLNESGYEFILLSESVRFSRRKTEQAIKFPSFIMPKLLGFNPPLRRIFFANREDTPQSSNIDLVAQNLCGRFADMENDCARFFASLAYKSFNEIVNIVKPNALILWNQFSRMHPIYKDICHGMGIPVLFFEFGSLPGTFDLDVTGQMGESDITKKPEQFLLLPVSNSELQSADTVLHYLKESRLNRNVQIVTGEADLLRGKLKKNRPVILYAGQNDFECGIYPYTEHSRKYHSPVFKTSDEAAFYLLEIAKKNDWNFIYKPHPLMLELIMDFATYPEEMLLAKKIDINEIIDIADVCVTILSQTAYLALIRKKALLSLGYMQLYQKGCCYEAFRLEDIEPQLRRAVAEGITTEHMDMFRMHVAQMLKYKLYDDLLPRDLRYGRTLELGTDYIEKIIRPNDK